MQKVESKLSEYHLAIQFSEADAIHWFLNGPVHSYVVCNGDNLTDFISFYSLNTLTTHERHKEINTAYLFYYYTSPGPMRFSKLLGSALIKAKELGFDVFNSLDIMENIEGIEAHKFVCGSGELKYYLYNWQCPPTKPSGIGLMLF